MLQKVNWVAQGLFHLTILFLIVRLIRGDGAGVWLPLAAVVLMVSLATQYLWMRDKMRQQQQDLPSPDEHPSR